MKSRCLFSRLNPWFLSACRSSLLLAVVYAEALVCSSQASQSVSPAATTPEHRQKLRGHIPRAAAQLAPVDRLAAAAPLKLAIGLPVRDPAALSALIQQIYNPASPFYRHYLTPSEFAAQFGPAEQEYQAVVDFVRTNGLTVSRT